MRKSILTILGLCLSLAGFGEGKPIPYYSDLGGDEEWTLVDANDDGKTWVAKQGSDFSPAGTNNGIMYEYGSNVADDWYISPAVTLEGGKEYKLRFWGKTKSNKENVSIYMAALKSPDDLKAGEELIHWEDYSNTTLSRYAQTFTPEESGDYYFGIYIYSPGSRWNVFFTAFEIVENVFAPGPVTDLVVTPGEDRALEATLTWKLPAVDGDGVAFGEGVTVESVTISRDGTVVATLDGEATQWTDNEEKGLAPGTHEYSIVATVSGKESPVVKLTSPYIGPLVAQSLPWTQDYKHITQDELEFFYTLFNGEDSESVKPSNSYPERKFWYISGSAGYSYLSKYPARAKKNDWFVTPPLKCDATGVYKVTVREKAYSATFGTATNFYIGYGTTEADFGDEQKIGSVNADGSEKDYSFFVNLEEGKEFYLACQENYENSQDYQGAYIYNLSIVPWHVAPLHVENPVAKVEGEKVVLEWKNPTSTNIDSEIDALSKIEVYRGDKEEPIAILDDASQLASGVNVSFEDEEAAMGINRYKVIPYIGENPADGEPAEVITTWVGDDTQSLPYTCDFKDSSLHCLWKAIDKDGDSNSWTLATTGAILNLPMGEDALDDMLLSAPLALGQGYYKVTAKVKGGEKNMEVGIGFVDKDFDGSDDVALQTITLPGNTYTSDYAFVVPSASSEGARLAIRYNGSGASADKKSITVAEVKVEYQPVIPSAVTDVKAEVTEGTHSVKLTWVNPSGTNIEGLAPVLTKVEVHRLYLTTSSEPELIETIEEDIEAGGEMEYVDVVPNPGEYRYRVYAYNSEDYGQGSAVTGWIGGGLSMPYEPENFSKWSIHNLDNDENTWEVSQDLIKLSCKDYEPDDWAISLPLELEAGKHYELSMKAYTNYYDGNVSFDLHIGTDATPEAMTTNVGTLTATQSKPSAAEEFKFTVRAVDPEVPALLAEEGDAPEVEIVKVPAGKVYVGFHGNTVGNMAVSNFAIRNDKDMDIATGIEEAQSAKDTLRVIAGDSFIAIEGGTGMSYTIFGVDGIMISTGNIGETGFRVTLSEGIYIVKVGKAVKKVTVR
ncbi:MAG: choice-of-anchor J domain-containing protein [Muribaculaceae bacterium]|nr:choice-of-anchor J domain-containing protein [Muribaculaceae bacterium]